MWEDLGGTLPDAIVVPVGNGTLLLGAALAVGELHRHGLIAARPALIAVQAEAASPRSPRSTPGRRRPAAERPPRRPPTLAEGIAIPSPPRARADPARGPGVGRHLPDRVRRTGSARPSWTWRPAACSSSPRGWPAGRPSATARKAQRSSPSAARASSRAWRPRNGNERARAGRLRSRGRSALPPRPTGRGGLGSRRRAARRSAGSVRPERVVAEVELRLGLR